VFPNARKACTPKSTVLRAKFKPYSATVSLLALGLKTKHFRHSGSENTQSPYLRDGILSSLLKKSIALAWKGRSYS
jgi:hypothetical protein